MSENIIEIRQLDKYFGGVHALRGVDISIPKGQVTAIVGDNGAGKSTLIKVLSGIYEPTSGYISFDGQKVTIPSPKTARNLGI